MVLHTSNSTNYLGNNKYLAAGLILSAIQL